MGGVRLSCRGCGGSLPSDARFCPGCGFPADNSLDEPLIVGYVSDADVTAIGPSMERSRPLIVVAAVVGALLVAWSVMGGGDGSAESVGLTTTIAEAASEGSDARSITSTASGSFYVNGVRGPVLGDEVAGVLLVTTWQLRLTLIDLGTGEITFVPHGLPNRGEIAAVAGEEVLIRTGRFLRTINLRTEVESDAMPFGDPGVVEWLIVGSGGPDSVWVVPDPDWVEQGGGPLAASVPTVLRVDFGGRTLESFEFEEQFSVRFAGGSRLYLDGAGGSWVFDTVTNSVTALNGQIIETNSEAIVLLSCDSTLQCQVHIDTGTGMTRTTALTAADVTNSELHIAPDFTRALVHRYAEDDDVALTYIDLVTGERSELRWPIGLYGGVVWVPDTPWIVGVEHEPDEEFADLTAVNTDNGAIVELRLPRSRDPWELSRFSLIPST